jgi:isopentenyl-diphosphate delta-isomerase
MEQRKNDHITLSFSSQVDSARADSRFNYEPLLGSWEKGDLAPFPFLGKTMRVPIWVSSMTGGSQEGMVINRNLARACAEFGMGMGLGSCRILLDNQAHFDDFNMRPVIGDDLPLYANIGIVQVEELLAGKSYGRLVDLVQRLKADGLVIHVNPVQEWLQQEGTQLQRPAIETIAEFLAVTDLKIIVKEVGQGMGPGSIKMLMDLPVEAFELAGFGGTNFAKIELSRNMNQKHDLFDPVVMLGHTALEMVEMVNALANSGKPLGCRQLIISGGLTSYLDGYYLMSKSRLPAIYGMASGFLRHARGDYRELQSFISDHISGLKFAKAFLQIRN